MEVIRLIFYVGPPADGSDYDEWTIRLGIAADADRWTEYILGHAALIGVCSGQARFLSTFDLRHAAVMDDELHDAVAQALDLLADKCEPIGRDGRRLFIIGSGGGAHGGKDGEFNNQIV
jgi:hypothetical protein